MYVAHVQTFTRRRDGNGNRKHFSEVTNLVTEQSIWIDAAGGEVGYLLRTLGIIDWETRKPLTREEELPAREWDRIHRNRKPLNPRLAETTEGLKSLFSME